MTVAYSALKSSKNGSEKGYWVESRLYLLVMEFPVFILVLAVVLGFVWQLLSVEGLHVFFKNPLTEIPDQTNSPRKLYPLLQENQGTSALNEPLWNRPALFNISSFRWLRNNVSLCQVDVSHPKTQIVSILIHSARSHFSERLIIRKSWGSLLLYKHWSIRLIFLIGEADRGLPTFRNGESFHEAQLDEEQRNFGDIVQGNFIDTYKNLTYKHMMGYKWILNFCPNASFVMKTDDDMFIDLMQFLTWRDDDLKKKSKISKSRAGFPAPELYCSTYVGTKPQRCVGCKWHTSEAEWPLDYFPDYCSGSCYGITVHLIKELYSMLTKVPFFWIDDVFATGILLEEVRKLYPDYEPQYRHLWGQVRALDFRNFRPMCERHDITMRRKFGVVVPVSRGSHFERDMMCLWNKTMYDDFNKNIKEQRKNDY